MLIKREKFLVCELGDLGLIFFRIYCYVYSMYWIRKGIVGIYRLKYCIMF